MTVKLFVRTAIWLGAMALVLFGAAGNLRWPAGWAFLIIMGASSLANGLWLAKHDPDLLGERLAPIVQADQERWDKILIIVALAAWTLWFLYIAIDAGRFHWSPVPLWLQRAGAILILLGMYIVFVTFRENSYAAPVVKIQSGRGHRVISTGPYSRVRHPMYAGAFLVLAGTPMLLGAWIGLLLSPIIVAIIAVRAVREEQVLAERLGGYAEYVERVRYRLIPGVW